MSRSILNTVAFFISESFKELLQFLKSTSFSGLLALVLGFASDTEELDINQYAMLIMKLF